MILFVAFIAVTFIARLFYLQVLSPNYQERAKRNAYYNTRARLRVSKSLGTSLIVTIRS